LPKYYIDYLAFCQVYAVKIPGIHVFCIAS